MNSEFSVYYNPTEQEKKNLFEHCVFVFDSNTLLDIYRIGHEKAEKVLNLIERYKSRIVIPYQAAKEYHESMMGLISKLIESYSRFLEGNNEDRIKDRFIEALSLQNSPAMRLQLVDTLSDSIKEFLEKVVRERDYLREQFDKWELQTKISNVIGALILPSLPEEELREVPVEGESRYARGVPPGFRDFDKVENKFGDLIIWKEILSYVGKHKNSIVFISSDQKDDWINVQNGMNCGPRVELQREFKQIYHDGTFQIYTLNAFLEYANNDKKELQEDEMRAIQDMLSLDVDILQKETESSIKADISVPSLKSNAEPSQNSQKPEERDFVEVLSKYSEEYEYISEETDNNSKNYQNHDNVEKQ